MSGSARKTLKKPPSVGELLVQEGKISPSDLVKIQKFKRSSRKNIISVLLENGYVNESDLISTLAAQYNCQVINVEDYNIPKKLIKLVPKKLCVMHTVIPISCIANSLIVACTDPSDQHCKEQLMFITGYNIEFVLSKASAIQEAIRNHYEESEFDINKIFSEIEVIAAEYKKSLSTSDGKKDAEDEESSDDVAIVRVDPNDKEPVIQCVNRILSSAINKRSSDIHFEPYEKTCRVRFRIDGKLHEMFHPPKSIASLIIARLKVIAKLDISEKRKPQDGRIKICLEDGKEIDFRVSSIPTSGGEKIVLRILDSSVAMMKLSDLGMDKKEMKTFLEALHKPQGLILITGPTGSGKTTTIYSGLSILNTPVRNISTAEDPVEYKIDGLNQVQMRPTIGLNFQSALRSFLRQDPDVILVGEIRDYETAEIAFKAAATGHLVVSTLHTNDTTSTAIRLLDIGIPDYSIADNVSLIIGQRLLRKVCPKCASQCDVSSESLKLLGVPEKDIEKIKPNIKKGKGCTACSKIGYKGRVAVYEMLRVTDKVQKGLSQKMIPSELKKMLMKSGDLKTVRQSGIEKMSQGMVSFEEVFYGTVSDFS